MSDIKTYPLTSPQLSIWFTEKMYPGTSISNVAGTLRIKDNICYSLLEKALNCLIKNNEGLRLRICLDESGNPVQYVQSYQYIEVEVKDFSDCEDPIKSLFEWDTQETLKSFELIDHDLYRFIIFKLSDSEGGIYTNIHHIISDAWSLSIISNLVIDYYRCLKNGQTEGVIEKFMPSYVSYIENEQLYKNSSRFEKDELFWNHQFEIPPEMTILKSRKTQQVSTRSKRKTFVVPKKFSAKLQEYCRSNKVSPYPLFLSALAMYINRVCSKEDITIGTPILNRLNLTDKSTVGMFISTIPLRMKIKGSETFTSFSKEVLDLCALTYRHQRYPYEKILKQVRDNHGFTNNLYDIVLSYQNSKFNKATEFDSSTRWHFNGQQSNSLTIHINDRDDEGSLIIDYDYHEELYFDKEIEFLHRHVISLLWHALDNPEKRICSIEMISENERKKILYDFNNTQKEYPKDKTIHQLFEEQVARTPDQVALIFENTQLTYRELNEKANSLARVLRENGVVADTVVAIMVHRSVELIVGILAVLKAGGAYLYIDSKLPDERINYMLNDSKIEVMLTEKAFYNKIDDDIFCLDLFDSKNFHLSSDNLSVINNSNNLAYMIFTSGSTGKPKAVLIEHRSLNNFIIGANELIGIDVGRTILSMATASFDIFVFELFSTLLSGSRLVLTSDDEKSNAEKLLALFNRYEIEIVHGTPAIMNLLLDYNERIFNPVKLFIIGGEQFTSSLYNRLNKHTQAKFFNGYGPSECTVGVTFKELSSDLKINIGKPISNTKIYILDEFMNLVPIGIQGEIYIGGKGLARGYLNQPKLTEERFIDNPFCPGEKIYKTGDLGKWYAKGEIEFVGRIDNQVKINGYRIELDEICNQILCLQGVQNAIVIDQPTINHKRVLCAYIVSNKHYSPEDIQHYLGKTLPEYMIPAHISFISRLPVNSHGKVDRHSLPLLHLDKSKSIYVMPESQEEAIIQSIWENVLNIKHISVNDSIFEIGGDSLDIISISSVIYKKFNVDFPVTEFKTTNTIRKMAQYILEKTPSKINSKNEQICLLRSGRTNLFFIHAGNGEVDNYINLSRCINKEFACWGIKMGYASYAPSNLAINELARKYIGYIKGIQPKGPYYLAGWCIGGTIAFEMANILESENQSVRFLGLLNSIAPQKWENTCWFTPESELKLINDFFHIDLPKIVNEDDLTLIDLWDQVLTYLNSNKNSIQTMKNLIPKDMSRVIPKFETKPIEDIVRYVNCIRTLHISRALYYPNRILKTNMYFFNATEDTIIKDKQDNNNKWNQYCDNETSLINIKADHYSLFESPGLEDLAQAMNAILDDIEVGCQSYA